MYTEIPDVDGLQRVRMLAGDCPGSQDEDQAAPHNTAATGNPAIGPALLF